MKRIRKMNVCRSNLPKHEIERIYNQVKGYDPAYLTHVFDVLFQAEPLVKLSSQPRFALEMVFLRFFQIPPVLSVETLIEKLDQFVPQFMDFIRTSESNIQK